MIDHGAVNSILFRKYFSFALVFSKGGVIMVLRLCVEGSVANNSSILPRKEFLYIGRYKDGNGECA